MILLLHTLRWIVNKIISFRIWIRENFIFILMKRHKGGWEALMNIWIFILKSKHSERGKNTNWNNSGPGKRDWSIGWSLYLDTMTRGLIWPVKDLFLLSWVELEGTGEIVPDEASSLEQPAAANKKNNKRILRKRKKGGVWHTFHLTISLNSSV